MAEPKTDRFLMSEWVAPLFELPARLPPTRSWVGHIPFLFLLFDLARPRTFVELGVHDGTSFLAACEAAKRFATGTHCHGIDTWRGDAHAGFYNGDPVYEDLRDFVASRYSSCELVRSTFDEALPQFQDQSIDLLHIDGLHTYKAVSHDFESWQPKLSDRAIVLVHDTEVRRPGYLVCRFWSEVKQKHRFLEFPHSFGLGVLFTGKELPAGVDHFLRRLQSEPGNLALLQQVCEAAGATLPLRFQRRDAAATAGTPVERWLTAPRPVGWAPTHADPTWTHSNAGLFLNGSRD